jgi:hypothetical protein
MIVARSATRAARTLAFEDGTRSCPPDALPSQRAPTACPARADASRRLNEDDARVFLSTWLKQSVRSAHRAAQAE